MNLSMTSDFVTSTGCPEPCLRRIAAAGFTHVHWCHQWNTDFMYLPAEISAIRTWLSEEGLALTDLHASAGKEKNWGSLREHERQAGVELVRNRLRMAAELGTDVIIMHLTEELNDPATAERGWEQLYRSLDALAPDAAVLGVRIAIENGDFDQVDRILASYGPEYVGLCYDAGHGNLRDDGLDRLTAARDRLISVHLHDNDGSGDQHKLLFSGTVDWERLAGIIAASSYTKWVSMETVMRNTGIEEEEDFLNQAYTTGTRFAEMIDNVA